MDPPALPLLYIYMVQSSVQWLVARVDFPRQEEPVAHGVFSISREFPQFLQAQEILLSARVTPKVVHLNPLFLLVLTPQRSAAQVL